MIKCLNLVGQCKIVPNYRFLANTFVWRDALEGRKSRQQCPSYIRNRSTRFKQHPRLHLMRLLCECPECAELKSTIHLCHIIGTILIIPFVLCYFKTLSFRNKLTLYLRKHDPTFISCCISSKIQNVFLYTEAYAI